MHRHATIVTLNDLIRIFAVVSQANGADEDVLSAPRLGPIQQGILLEQAKNKNKNKNLPIIIASEKSLDGAFC